MRIGVQLQKKDYLDFLKYYCFKRDLSKKISITIVLSFVLGFSNWGSYTLNRQTYVLHVLIFELILVLITFLLPYIISILRFIRQYNNDQFFFDRKIFTAFENGIDIESKTKKEILRWENIKIVEKYDSTIFIISFNKKLFLLPKRFFLSEKEIEIFLETIQHQVSKFSPPHQLKNTKELYKWGWLGLIPLAGGISGLLLVLRGIFQYKDKLLILIGTAGILFTIAIFYLMNYEIKHGASIPKGFAGFSQDYLDDLVKDIEFYKLKNGVYPDSLPQLLKYNKLVPIEDPLSITGTGKKINFNYKRIGEKYILFSSGIDKIPNTSDDIYPDTKIDSSKMELIKK